MTDGAAPVPTRAGAPSTPAGSGQGLELTGVSKAFGAGAAVTQVLDGIAIRVGRGQFVTVIGPSGCGKSTLLRIVAGLVPADRGTVSIFGESVEKAVAAKHIGFVPQAPALLPWRSVLDNVRLSLQVNRRAGAEVPRRYREPAEVLESFGLGDALDRRPGQLSGGMQQRVAIARAFVFDPSVLLMDEPFSALDELTREDLRHQLLDVWQSDGSGRKTVLFVTHSVAEAVALSDVIVVLSARPGTVRAVVPVDLPRPRADLVETTSAFHLIERRVRLELRGAWDERRA